MNILLLIVFLKLFLLTNPTGFILRLQKIRFPMFETTVYV
jgi:hypothetical protein